eukprot:CAMPEP_0183333338 /NCGR_PEP_ID=MMETSP0164_2-20130417/2257_2 /TAXON_ID=221442 /ORGANISM="Coccolithus pelagicus ssp braarudi, Strain PLY182g" /LENGTH=105 /DNA_ID=CAMNT_0025502237 /DNA_START=953 /DNA_END=1267 /DNA_ORIENTATION=-
MPSGTNRGQQVLCEFRRAASRTVCLEKGVSIISGAYFSANADCSRPVGRRGGGLYSRREGMRPMSKRSRSLSSWRRRAGWSTRSSLRSIVANATASVLQNAKTSM